jgi:phosphatidylserine decarboxylase
VVLEGRWKEGFVAIAAIGATNIGSIRVTCHGIKMNDGWQMNLLGFEE